MAQLVKTVIDPPDARIEIHHEYIPHWAEGDDTDERPRNYTMRTTYSVNGKGCYTGTIEDDALVLRTSGGSIAATIRYEPIAEHTRR